MDFAGRRRTPSVALRPIDQAPTLRIDSRFSAAHLPPFSLMKFLLSFVSRPNRRGMLRDLHAFGIVSVFRRDSIFRLWEPLRENRGADQTVG
jgi:hypothetical protein